MRSKGSICVFLALSLLLILSLILTCLEAARYSAGESYAQILLKTATESVLSEYYGPLFEDYHVFALDSGYGNKTACIDEMEARLQEYMLDNVWKFQPERLSVTGTRNIFADNGDAFLKQAYAYEKYTAAVSVAEEVISRVKSLGDQDRLKKVFKKKLEIEDGLSLIDEYTLDLMRLIDGVDISPTITDLSVEVYHINPDFVKKFFIRGVDPTTTAINNPSVFSKLKSWYINPVEELEKLREALPGYAETVQKRLDCEEKITVLEGKLNEVRQKKQESEKRLAELNSKIAALEKSIEEAEKTAGGAAETAGKAAETAGEAAETAGGAADNTDLFTENLENLKSEAIIVKQESDGYLSEEKGLEEELASLNKQLDEILVSEKRQGGLCRDRASTLYNLCTNVHSELKEVISVVDNITAKQEQIRPLVEGYESIVDTIKPVVSEETGDSLTDSLEYMKAYVGMDSSKAEVTDFLGIRQTAEYDFELMSEFDAAVFLFDAVLTYDNIMRMYDGTEGLADRFKRFSYSKLVFDYSKIQEKPIENRLAAEFEENVAKGYLSLFLDSEISVSEKKLISELLPTMWFELGAEEGISTDSLTAGASDKSAGELVDGADEASSLSEIADFLERGIEAAGSKLLEALYMTDHFKSFREYSSVGDTVMDYELEYILSGLKTDSGNLAAAATKIMLLRLPVAVLYTMTNSRCRAQAEAAAMAAMGFTGLPFLAGLLKYLILFLWGTAQAVIETSAILQGRKVPVLTGSDSFCLTLSELPVFASLVSEKAKNLKESEWYLDYNNYLYILLLIENSQSQAARAMDLIQENIRYKYNEDFLMNNALIGFSAEAEFSAPSQYSAVLAKIYERTGNDSYLYTVEDIAAY